MRLIHSKVLLCEQVVEAMHHSSHRFIEFEFVAKRVSTPCVLRNNMLLFVVTFPVVSLHMFASLIVTIDAFQFDTVVPNDTIQCKPAIDMPNNKGTPPTCCRVTPANFRCR